MKVAKTEKSDCKHTADPLNGEISEVDYAASSTLYNVVVVSPDYEESKVEPESPKNSLPTLTHSVHDTLDSESFEDGIGPTIVNMDEPIRNVRIRISCKREYILESGNSSARPPHKSSYLVPVLSKETNDEDPS